MRIAFLLVAILLSGCTAAVDIVSGLTGSLSGSVAGSSQSMSGSSSGARTNASAFGPEGPVVYRAMWDGYKDARSGYTGEDLTRITLHELNQLDDSFYALVPKDTRFWCPAFARQSLEGRKAFYLGLMSGIARYETDFRAHVKYLEAGGHYSRGLLQLGQLALSYYPEGRCDASGDPRQLHDLQENLSCGVMLVQHWVSRDGYIASDGNIGEADARYFGAARYWSTLREGRRGHDAIAEFTRSLPVCGG